MSEMEQKNSLTAPRWLPAMITVVFVLQPLMDILSYWMDRLGMPNTATLLLRFAVLSAVALAGFLFSRRKKVYLIAAGVVVLYLAGHCISCASIGYLDPVHDLTNFIRVIQMPVFVFCLISFFRTGEACYRAVENGLIINFWIITASIVLSLLTRTASATYTSNQIGLIGWFSTGNAQSAVMSLLTPMAICFFLRRKNLPVLALTTAAGFAQLYFLGTRLAYFTICVTAAGVLLAAVLTRKVSWKQLAVVMLGMLVCVVFVRQSPMVRNQAIYNGVMSERQNNIEAIMEEIENEPEEEEPATEENKVKVDTVMKKYRRNLAVQAVYREYCTDFCQRFGVKKAMEIYNYTTRITELTATRPHKIMFCRLLMEEYPPIARFFGMELSRMTYNDTIYDVENDFHGIFFLYGGVGLALMLAFLAWFVFLIVRSLIRNFRRYFTLEAVAFGMAFCLAMIYAYCTAGVLRRPNASFYLSVVLAGIYYLTCLRDYEKEEAGARLQEKTEI